MKKNILFIAYSFNAKFGVGSQRSRALSNLLSEKNYNIKLIEYEKDKSTILSNLNWLFNALVNILFYKHDKIYLSCGPFFHLLPIAILAKIRGKKLYIDFRDAWSLNILTDYGKLKFSFQNKKSYKYWLAQTIEKICYKQCYKFIVCTQGMYQEYGQLFKNNSKLLLIMNGFEHKYPPNTTTFQSNNPIQFICVGKFAEYSEPKATKIVLMLRELALKTPIHITMVGCSYECNFSIFQKLTLEKQVTFLQRLPHNEVLKLIENSDVGLLIIRDEHLDYGTKIFDYLACSKPVLTSYDSNDFFYKTFEQFLITVENNCLIYKDYYPKNTSEFSRNYQFNELLKHF